MAFQERLSRIQGKRTHEAMAEYLEMPVESWKKCVNRGDSFPIRKLPRLALLAGIPVESLIKGDGTTSSQLRWSGIENGHQRPLRGGQARDGAVFKSA
jgi:hypothetical protein